MQRIKRTKYKEMIDFLYKMQASMVLYSKEKYNKQINPQINVSLANSKSCSRYKNYDFSIDYNIRHYTKPFLYRDDIDSDRFMFTEYKHIEQDPVIGSIKGNWKTIITALVAHEFAHALDYSVDAWPHLTKPEGFSAYNPKTNREKRGHGESWQLIYRDLREKFVNNGYCQQF